MAGLRVLCDLDLDVGQFYEQGIGLLIFATSLVLPGLLLGVSAGKRDAWEF